jgi:hypothetical protein
MLTRITTIEKVIFAASSISKSIVGRGMINITIIPTTIRAKIISVFFVIFVKAAVLSTKKINLHQFMHKFKHKLSLLYQLSGQIKTTNRN